MGQRLVWAIVVGVGLAGALPARAQEKGQIGIAMGYPTSVGIVWQLSDRLALRPDVTFSTGENDFTSTTTLTFNGQPQTSQTRLSSSNTALGGGISGLFYLSKQNGLSTFVSPRYRYLRATTTPPQSLVSSLGETTPILASQQNETTSSVHGVSGSFGVQYAATRRFSVFGEVGVEYARGRTSGQPTNSTSGPIIVATSRSESTSHSFGLRSGGGVVWYFR